MAHIIKDNSHYRIFWNLKYDYLFVNSLEPNLI